MTRARGSALLGWLRDREPEMVALLERLVSAESPSVDAAAQQGPLRALADEFKKLDYLVRQVRGTGVGDHLYARPRERVRAAPFQLLIGHMDTVWPLGTLGHMPVRRVGDKMYGPGTYDMKAGLVQLVFALRALQTFELVPGVTPVVLLNSDEEIGSGDSERVIRSLARGAERAFVLECGEGSAGRLKIARKGVGRYELTVHGLAAHAGTSFEQGASAIFELSHQIQRLFALNDPERGITVNVGTVDGGLRPNVVAPQAAASIGVRVPTEIAAHELDSAIRGLQPVIEGTSLEVEGGIGRPPMEPTPRNQLLLATARRLGREVGLTLEDAGLVGGGSDANTTSLYTATLDGLGPIGDGDHAADEHVSIASIADRAALLAMLVLEPAHASSRPVVRTRRPHVIVVGDNETSAEVVAAWRAAGIESELVPARGLRARLRDGDTVLGRLDVLPTLDGVEPGLLELLLVERRGFHVLNSASTLLSVHDKLRTAHMLGRAGLPHPRTRLANPGGRPPPLAAPVVVKPRFGSWGKDVYRCETQTELERCLEEIRTKGWFTRHGALVQELVPPCGHDLRLLVAGGTVVGAIERTPAAGEWRTNISLGGSKRHHVPASDAAALAVAAASAMGGDLVGVDLLPIENGYVILELNGAVEFDRDYSLPGNDVYTEAAGALGLLPAATHSQKLARVASG
ncbi:MAG TPA: M20/M25/M40 family metallo-hydrolase [Gaiellaceae bacterium]